MLDKYTRIEFIEHSRRIQYRERWWEERKDYVRLYRAEVVLATINQDGAEWLDEHVRDWRKHVGLTYIYADYALSTIMLMEANRAEEITKIIRREMAYQIAKEIIDKLQIDTSEVPRDLTRE